MSDGARAATPLSQRWQYGRLKPMPEVEPPEWALVRIAELARLESGHTPSRKHPEYWSGTIPWVSLHDSKNLDRAEIHETSQTIGQLGLANSSARLLPAGTVVFSRTATVGKATILGREMATSQDFANYVCGPRVHNRFLMQLLRFLQPEWKRLMAGSTHNTIYMPVFENLQVLLPPFAEQRKIAEILSTMDEAIAATQAVIEQLQVVKKAMMADLLTRGLPGRHTRFKQTELGEAPDSWEVCPLGTLIARGPDNGIYKPQSDYGTGSPIVRIDAFDNGDVLNGTGLRRVRLSVDEIERYALRPDDLLINRVNSLSHIAKTAFVGRLAEPTVFESNMMRLSVDQLRLHPGFAFRVISSPAAKAYFAAHAKQAVAQASINQGDVRGLPVPVPPLAEQNEIVRLAEAIEARLSTEVALLDGKQNLKAALMASLLTGELRVNVNEAEVAA